MAQNFNKAFFAVNLEHMRELRVYVNQTYNKTHGINPNNERMSLMMKDVLNSMYLNKKLIVQEMKEFYKEIPNLEDLIQAMFEEYAPDCEYPKSEEFFALLLQMTLKNSGVFTAKIASQALSSFSYPKKPKPTPEPVIEPPQPPAPEPVISTITPPSPPASVVEAVEQLSVPVAVESEYTMERAIHVPESTEIVQVAPVDDFI